VVLPVLQAADAGPVSPLTQLGDDICNGSCLVPVAPGSSLARRLTNSVSPRGMMSSKLPPVPVSDAMLQAGVAVWEATADHEIEERLTLVYRAMIDAVPPVPVYASIQNQRDAYSPSALTFSNLD
jgi:hypothetical protein